jgi:hypothetical protein
MRTSPTRKMLRLNSLLNKRAFTARFYSPRAGTGRSCQMTAAAPFERGDERGIAGGLRCTAVGRDAIARGSRQQRGEWGPGSYGRACRDRPEPGWSASHIPYLGSVIPHVRQTAGVDRRADARFPVLILPMGVHFAGRYVQRHLPVENVPGKVEHHSGTAERVFSFSPESRSASSRKRVQLRAGSPLFEFAA